MLCPSTHKSSWCLLFIFGSLLVQQCLLQLNPSCEAANPLARFMSRTSPTNEAETSGDNKTDSDLTQVQAHVPGGREQSISSRLREAANLAIAPARSYFQLIQRYKNWRNDYNQLQEEFGHDHLTDEPILRDAIDVLRIEYAQVDQELHDEACHWTGDEDEQANKTITETDVENVDFILRVLKLLINRLEARLEMLKRGGIKAALDERLKATDSQAEHEAERIEESVREAAQRAKRIAAKSARGLLKNELLRVAQTLAFNAVATYVVNTNQAAGADTIGMMSRIEPIVLLMGSANTGLLVSYMRDIKMRAGFKIFNYSVSMFTCKRKPEASSDPSPLPPAHVTNPKVVDTSNYQE